MSHPLRLGTALLLTLFVVGTANAQTSAAGPIVAEQPWARATPKGAKTGAAYMTLMNKGPSSDRLIGATTLLADKVQFHQEIEDSGVSHMREMPGVDLAPGAKIVFKPGALHMMIVGLRQPLTQGQTFQLTLQFQKAGNLNLTIPIQGVGAMQHDDMGAMAHGSRGMTK